MVSSSLGTFSFTPSEDSSRPTLECTQGCNRAYERSRSLRVVLLIDGDRPFPDAYAQSSRQVAHIRHLEPLYQLLLAQVEQLFVGVQHEEVTYMKHQAHQACLILVKVYAWI